MPLKLFPATYANPDIESLKSLYKLLLNMFVPHASEIWTKSCGPNYTKFWALTKNRVFKTICDKANFEDICAAEQFLMLNY